MPGGASVRAPDYYTLRALRFGKGRDQTFAFAGVDVSAEVLNDATQRSQGDQPDHCPHADTEQDDCAGNRCVHRETSLG